MSKLTLPPWMQNVRGSWDNDEDDEPVDMLLAEPIGFDPGSFTGMSSDYFGRVLNSIKKSKVVNLLINTGGGRVDDGVAMYNMARARGNVNTVVIGQAASMGAVLFQAGATRKMMKGTMLMVHNPMITADGDEKAMEMAIEILRKCKDSIVNILHDRSGLGKKEVSALMDATTYMTAEEAKKNGFADEVIDGSDAYNRLARFPSGTIKNFQRMPAPVVSGAGTEEPIPGGEENKMKQITNCLASLGLISSAGLTDEGVIVNELTARHAVIRNKADKADSLQGEVSRMTKLTEDRVRAAVKNAITEGIVKAERETSLINMGMADEEQMTNYISDLREARGSAATQPAPRGSRPAPPAPPSGETGAVSNEEKMRNLRDELKTCSPARASEIGRELRALRGHGDMFAAAK